MEISRRTLLKPRLLNLVFLAMICLSPLGGFAVESQDLSGVSDTNVLKDYDLGDLRVTNPGSLHTLQSYEAPVTLEEWKDRKAKMRRDILVHAGMWPMPGLGPVTAEVFGRSVHDGYSIEKVILETFPGFVLTGNLFRPYPSVENQKYPGIICPHGHWDRGRFEDSGTASVPGRALSFARQGYVCITYDMIGYGDNVNVFYPHRFRSMRDMLWGVTPGGLQLLNSVRVIDFIQSLPDVDDARIGCTGASGGGTQTFMISAVDDRVKVAAPVNMISHSMQGGCVCENLPHLRIDSNNMEIGALMAPRPLMMVSAGGDWTRKTPEIEYPAVRSVYQLYDAEEMVVNYHQEAPHNYNQKSRQAVYDWFGRWFYPDRPTGDFMELEFTVPNLDQLSVFANRKIHDSVKSRQQILSSVRKLHEEQYNQYLSGDPDSFLDTFGTTWRVTMGISEPLKRDIKIDHLSNMQLGGVRLEKFILMNSVTGQRVPVNLWMPGNTPDKNMPNPVLLVDVRGKRGIVRQNGVPGTELRQLLDQGGVVMGMDCFGTGEFLVDDRFKEHKGIIRLYHSYNRSDTVNRVHDILLAETYLALRFGKPTRIVGRKGAGGWVLLAHGLADRSLETTVDLAGLDATQDRCFVEDLMIPGIRRAGDFVTSIILGSQRKVLYHSCDDEQLDRRLKEAIRRSEAYREN